MVHYHDDFNDIEGSSIFMWSVESVCMDGPPLSLIERFKRAFSEDMRKRWKIGMYHGQSYNGVEFGPFMLTYDGI